MALINMVQGQIDITNGFPGCIKIHFICLALHMFKLMETCIPGFVEIGLDQPDHDLIHLELACEQLIWILARLYINVVA